MTVRPRMAIAGCGAVTAEYYRPALDLGGRRSDVVGLYDQDVSRAAALAMHFPQASCVASFQALLDLRADLVIIASPPAAHAQQSIAAVRSGSHVLCEKPMALCLEDASGMAEAAREHGRLLAVNMVRRAFPASRIVGMLVRNASLGRLLSISAFEGGAFRWPVRDQDYFSRAVSGGGVLADVGTHLIDLLTSWFGEATFVRYQDDALGGVEANALLELRWGDATASIRLSRDWNRPNFVDLEFEKARVRWSAEQINAVELWFNGELAPLKLQDASEPVFEACFAAQIEAVMDHLAGKPARLVSADQVLQTVRLVEQAYRSKELMPMPWLQPFTAAAHG